MEDLKPKIRFLDFFLSNISGENYYILRDPLGIFEENLVLSPESFFVLSMMNGENTIEDIRMKFFQMKGILPSYEEIYLLVQKFSNFGLLEDENFENIIKEKSKIMLSFGVREPVCSGTAYPSNLEDLKKFLKEIEEIETLKREKTPSFILSPHLDISLAKPAYAYAYKDLSLDTDLVVIFGVAHQGLSTPLSHLPLPFKTPLGIIPINEEYSKKWIEEFGMPTPIDIFVHFKEHSVELQILFLQYFLGDKYKILTFLVNGSKRDFSKYGGYFQNLIEEKKPLFIGGIDLSHIGPRYGDNFPAKEDFMEKIKGEEKNLIEFLLKKDILSFEKFLLEKENYLRICGSGVLRLMFEFPIKDGLIRFHHTGYMEKIESAVNCISMDFYF